MLKPSSMMRKEAFTTSGLKHLVYRYGQSVTDQGLRHIIKLTTLRLPARVLCSCHLKEEVVS